jgi:hypothetical protein
VPCAPAMRELVVHGAGEGRVCELTQQERTQPGPMSATSRRTCGPRVDPPRQ